MIMKTLLRLASKQCGRTAPNPVTAAAVVRDGQVISTGVHQGAGLPHAEIEALKKAGSSAKGATLYVNLEPCTHWGKTPPCTDAIIKAGIAKVVYAIDDPNPTVRKNPARQILEGAGIQVESGVMRDEALLVNEVFFKNQLFQKPFVTMKVGMSLDGKIALESGESKYITSLPSRRLVHRMRAQTGAILVGVNTMAIDKPKLDVRLAPAGSPQPKIIEVNPRELNWDDFLKNLYREGICSVLIEGGNKVYTSALEAGVIDKLVCFIAPKILAGDKSLSVFGGKGVPTLDRAYALSHVSVRRAGNDIVATGYLNDPLHWRH